MGAKRKEAQSRRLIRLTKAIENRDTLRPCEACNGNGYRIEESQGRTYRQVHCAWCEEGMTDKETYAMYARWRAILAANKCQP